MTPEKQNQNSEGAFLEKGTPYIPSDYQTESKFDIKSKISQVPEKFGSFTTSLKSFFIIISNRFRMRKIFIYFLLAFLVLIIPLNIILRKILNNYYFSYYEAQVVNVIDELSLEDLVIDGEPVVISRTEDSSVGIVHIRNKSRSLGAGNVSFSWDSFDSSGQKISSGVYSTFIFPESDKFVVLPFSRSITSLKTSILEESIVTSKPIFSNPLQPQAYNIQWKNDEELNNFSVSGDIQNSGLFSYKSAQVVILLRSPGGGIRGAMSTTVDSLLPTSVKEFEVYWPQKLFSDTVVDVRVYANIYSELDISLSQNTDPENQK